MTGGFAHTPAEGEGAASTIWQETYAPSVAILTRNGSSDSNCEQKAI